MTTSFIRTTLDVQSRKGKERRVGRRMISPLLSPLAFQRRDWGLSNASFLDNASLIKLKEGSKIGSGQYRFIAYDMSLSLYPFPCIQISLRGVLVLQHHERVASASQYAWKQEPLRIETSKRLLSMHLQFKEQRRRRREQKQISKLMEGVSEEFKEQVCS